MKNQTKHFYRSMAMVAAISEIMSGTQDQFQIRNKIMELGPYISRGKGREEIKKARHGKHMDAVRASKTKRNIRKRSKK